MESKIVYNSFDWYWRVVGRDLWAGALFCTECYLCRLVCINIYFPLSDPNLLIGLDAFTVFLMSCWIYI